MSLYSPQTDLGLLETEGRSLADLFALGKVPLQQAVSTQLVEAGQMMRREKSFEGIEFDSNRVYDVDSEAVDSVADSLNIVKRFDEDYAHR